MLTATTSNKEMQQAPAHEREETLMTSCFEVWRQLSLDKSIMTSCFEVWRQLSLDKSIYCSRQKHTYLVLPSYVQGVDVFARESYHASKFEL